MRAREKYCFSNRDIGDAVYFVGIRVVKAVDETREWPFVAG